MKYCLTREEMSKIENLAECALSAHSKLEAKRYIQQMYVAINDIWGSSKNILNEMIAAVDSATGQVSDKASKVNFAKQLIIKAQMFCVEKNNRL